MKYKIFTAGIVLFVAACQPSAPQQEQPTATVAAGDPAASTEAPAASTPQPLSAAVRELDVQVERDKTPFQDAARLEGGALVSTGKPGFFMYGPYVTVDAGQYTVEIEGSVESVGSGELIFDVASKGEVLGQQIVTANTAKGIIATINFDLPAATPDVEVRGRTGEGAVLQVTGYRLKPRG